ncbi:MAG: ComEA family DNA-binding protein [Dehalococcoidales bacterium]|nr:ComEA family DNA-binding protein [Dehalococcoidales bacterium]
METSRFKVNWTLVALLLVVIIITGVIFIGVRCRGTPVEITLTPEPQIVGTIYVGGAVNAPGLYSIFTGDTFDDIIAAAGGLTDGATFNDVDLIVGAAAEAVTPQKIDINRAELWLLEAIPGVGEVKAQAIIDYRNEHGFFHDIYELLNIPGFGEVTLENIKDFITVNS